VSYQELVGIAFDTSLDENRSTLAELADWVRAKVNNSARAMMAARSKSAGMVTTAPEIQE
jgi:hypothetical protein